MDGRRNDVLKGLFAECAKGDAPKLSNNFTVNVMRGVNTLETPKDNEKVTLLSLGLVCAVLLITLFVVEAFSTRDVSSFWSYLPSYNLYVLR